MAEVYWIRLPEHTDMFTQGYIGVTSKTAQQRFIEHINASKLSKRKHLKISNAILKYGAENLIVETLIICSDEYSLELETKLRPTEEIGWNLAPGGSKPPVRKGPMGPEFSRKLSERNRGKPKSEGTRRKISEALTGTKLPEDVIKKITNSHKKRCAENGQHPNSLDAIAKANLKRRKGIPVEKAFWRDDYHQRSPKKLQLLSIADKILDYYESKNRLVKTSELFKDLDLTHKDYVYKILQFFEGGWDPRNDPDWVEDFMPRRS